MLGAKGDGITDDTVAIQNWMTVAVTANEGNAYAPPTTYVVNDTVTILNGTNVVCHPDAIFDFRNGAGNSFNYCFFCSGVQGTLYNLTGVPALGASAVSMAPADAAHFNTFNQLVFVQSNDPYDPGITDTPQGELIRVSTPVVGGTVTFREPLITRLQYTTAGKASPITPVTIRWRGGQIIGCGANVGGFATGFYLYWGVDCIVEELFCRETYGQGIAFLSCINSHIINCRALDCLRAGSGYGAILNYACQDCTITGLYAEYCTTAAAQGGGPNGGITRRIKFINCVSHEAQFQAFGTHANCEDVDIIGCVAVNHNGSVAPEYVIEVNGANGRILNCWVGGNPGATGSAISTFSAATAVTSREEIRGNVVRNCTGEAYSRFYPASTLESLIIADNDFECSTSQGAITVQPKATGLAPAYVDIHNNTIKNSGTGYGIYVACCEEFLVKGNIIKLAATASTGVEIFDSINGIVEGNLIQLPTSANGLKAVTIAASGANTSHDILITGNRLDVVTPVAATGITIVTNANNISEAANDMQQATTPYSYGAGTGNRKGPWLPDPVAVVDLPPAAGNTGVSLMVNNANATTFWTVVAGGGGNIIKVTSDGTDWRIG